MDKILILTKRDWTVYVQIWDLTLNKMKEKGLKCNIKKFLGNIQRNKTHG